LPFTRSEHFAGQIVSIDKEGIEINLQECDKYFTWPDPESQSWINMDEIHVKLSTPSIDWRLHLIFKTKKMQEMKIFVNSLIFVKYHFKQCRCKHDMWYLPGFWPNLIFSFRENICLILRHNIPEKGCIRSD
jgi:hypothetical protein